MYKRLKVDRPRIKKKLFPRIKKNFLRLIGGFIDGSIYFSHKRGKKSKARGFSRIKNIVNFLEKRERFTLQTIILTAGVLTSQLIWTDFRFHMVILLAVASYILSTWSLKEDIKKIEWLLLFILPVLFTASLSLFYFLLPPRWIIRLTTTAFFAVGTYAILLVENIYNVAVQRSIQLLRAAQSVGLLLTLAVIFLSANVIFSLKLPFILNFLLMFTVSFFLALQSLWSIKLQKKLSAELLIYSLTVGIGIGELPLVLSFWPIENASFSLLLSASYYALIGIIQQYMAERLFLNVIREYIIVFVFTFILTFLTTRWGG